MILARIRAYVARVRSELERAFSQEHPPHDVAASFAIGVFVTSLPTLGAGLIVFLVLLRYVERISAVALLASLLVLNPVVKWGVYAASFSLGSLVLGPTSAGVVPEPSLSAGPEIVSRVLVGNAIIAVVFSVAGYLLALQVVKALRNRDIYPLERFSEDVPE